MSTTPLFYEECEVKRLERVTKEIEEWWATPRFKLVQRPYTAR